MSEDKAEVEVKIDNLDPDPVEAPLFANKNFKIVGHGFSNKDLDVYISTDKGGSNKISEIKVSIDGHTTITDDFLMVVAKPELGAPMGRVLWVAIKLKGKFQDAREGFKVV
ncbi:hypothetical protein ACC808_07410 [Rhizobium ruizarguesonis]|uniref:hypothetical protein n=1 Tax=Rhizobium ruizarguesonis TaxID=2081791 RepID=UPI001031AB76|nr:hypothetical protein [Rhizobium ruizarguesonis]MBY5886775.1 hypothetical protein [Rhizobium leguminosarum]QSZ05059.1 hypothetical protein J3P73_34070 [Rhizobium ruizarguesonis]TAT70495.1 hypothetical protein ELI52_36830 [Rhizobium ruizarguesonis]TAU99249.1 hypothetical protein ELI39_31450 [Rhizobium ruizarguesonis]TAZ87002.1 hypothetical protein ELH67_33500 [Rhizobium ruizarguesonis]